jgi:hypothetical protein
MTTRELPDLSPGGIADSLRHDAEQKLAAVEAGIEELQRSKLMLEKLLTTLNAGATIPGPRNAEAESDVEGGDEALADAPSLEKDQVLAAPAPADSTADSSEAPKRQARGGRKAAAKKTAAKKPAARQSGTAGVKTPRAAAGAPSLPDRVATFLQANTGPQKASEIAEGLYGEDVNPQVINRVRTACDSLAKRGRIDKDRQGATVFYQAHADAGSEAGQVVTATA